MALIYVTGIILLAVFLFLKVISYYFDKKSRSSKWIEKYLLLRRHNPFYGYIYALANKDDKAVIANYRKAVKRPHLRKYYPLLTILFCFYFQSSKGVEDEIAKLNSHSNKSFFMQWLKISQTNSETSLIPTHNKWMEETLFALVERGRGQHDRANRHLLKARNHSAGIVYYILDKERIIANS